MGPGGTRRGDVSWSVSLGLGGGGEKEFFLCPCEEYLSKFRQLGSSGMIFSEVKALIAG